MRPACLLLILLLFALAQPGAAEAQSTAAHQGASTSTSAAAKASGPAIIPGSPLAALTGAGPAPAAPAATPAPFGTDELGFAMTAVLGKEASATFSDFVSAVQRSTRLQPVGQWLAAFGALPERRAAALAILRGLAVVVLPGILLDQAVRLALRRPAGFCARHARPRDSEYLPDPDAPEAAPAEAPQGRPRRLSFHALGRRLGFTLLNFLLGLAPLACFAVAEQVLVTTGLVTGRAPHLAVVGIANAYLVARLGQVLLALLFAPATPSLRLLHLPTVHASWAMRRGLALIITIFISYGVISVAEILGLSKEGVGALLRLAALVIHLEVALAIWQARHVVRRWITGKPARETAWTSLRRRFGRVWYIVALFYVLALWVAWAAGVQDAFLVLLRAVLVVFIAMLLGRLAWSGSNNVLARLFPDAPPEDRRGAAVLERARAYNPLIRLLIRIAIAVLVLVLVLQGWGVDAIGFLLTDSLSRSWLGALAGVLVTVAVAIVLWETSNAALDGRVERLAASGRARQASRLRTLAPMLRAGIGAIIVLVTLIICLSRIGVNTTGLLAVSSVVGIAVGFGSQKLVQDIITGLFLLFEDAMQVGDVVTLASMSGTVERLSIRTIRLRAGDGSINIIPFSSVTTVTNQTRDFSYAQISILVGYKENIEHVNAVLKEIGAKMRAEPAWAAMMRDDLQLFGLDAFGELGLNIIGQIRTGPGQHWSVRREFYGRVQKRFVEEGIELPYRHQSFRLDVPAGELGPPPAPSAAPAPRATSDQT